ncbi:hypothetical protein PMY38_07120 [Clostridium tertium]|uniref:hypothetical protein n=1 Tax=Clostridium TaxID=1485 RepID=UPI00019AFB90|nr:MULTISPECIES: hypothetical protein [Clostridium]EEH96545.1 hypothetical protein CSBG_00171 [Clostridium sp. 7_2_43FAA]MBU6134070.1 hypothetical protein [Clostridium tertium]MDB1955118.1 hypothetical protein [Clostridium tertium]MDB1958363.1 hypothetical protein [Clostridium tertium]MDB1963097.1 hypothetical protein [Clostridium tertium]
MRHSYDSFDYWEELINENKTIRGHMFMDKLPNEKSIYIHSLVFCKNNGLNNTWSYFPNEKMLLGYIQYSFLQEAFYKWIYGKERMVISIPNIPVEKIILDGEKNKKISKEEADNMRRHVKMVKDCWSLPKDKLIRALQRFSRDFNRTWYGDNREFLYLKIFNTPKDLGEFVVNSSYMTTTEREFKDRIGISIPEWNNICERANKNKRDGEKFRDILLKSLTEII